MEPEAVIGSGPEHVYVYFAESERRLAQLEGRTFWPCKIGRSRQEVGKRILQQRPFTSMAFLPVVGLLLRTSDAIALESKVHHVLRHLQARVDSALGRDWFHTSPEQVRDIADGTITAPAASPRKRSRLIVAAWSPPTTGMLGELFRDILRFLEETRMPETTFGVLATGNRTLMHALRHGGDVRASTYDRLRAFMAKERAKRSPSHEAVQEAAAA